MKPFHWLDDGWIIRVTNINHYFTIYEIEISYLKKALYCVYASCI